MRNIVAVLAFIILAAVLLVPACSSGTDWSRTVENGDTVRINYTGKLLDGTVFDSSDEKGPVEFVIGGGQLIEGLDKGIVGMKEGETRTIGVTEDEAYGPYREELVITIDRNDFVSGVNPEPGMVINSVDEDGNPIIAIVREVSGDTVTIDTNHPLAGNDLVFEIELLKIL